MFLKLILFWHNLKGGGVDWVCGSEGVGIVHTVEAKE